MSRMHFCKELETYTRCNEPNCCSCCNRSKSPKEKREIIKESEVTVAEEEEGNKMPTYQNEFSLFAKAIKENLVEFRKERAQWWRKYSSSKTVNEGVGEEISSDVYKGRCILLRKMGFKTNRVRNHEKTLRPLKYFTLKRVIFDSEEDEICEDEVSKVPLSEDKPTGTTYQTVRVCRKKSSKKKPGKKDLINVGTKDPTRRILEKLKAGRRDRSRRSLLQPCRCENGKEVTFIIKGVCLCDKNKMKSFATTETCGEYCKSKIDKVSSEPYAVDSLEYYKSQRSMRKSSVRTKSPIVSSTKIRWADDLKSDEKGVENVAKQKEIPKKITISEGEPYKKEKVTQKPEEEKHERTTGESPKQQHREQRANQTKKDQQKKTIEDVEKPEKSQKQPHLEPQKVQIETPYTTEDDLDKPPSLVVIYKNRNPTKKSDLALTKEQKKIIDDYRNRLEHEQPKTAEPSTKKPN